MVHRIIITITGRAVRLQYKKSGPKPLPPEIKKRRVNISLMPHWHEIGKRVAEEQGVLFSRYVELLIYADSVCNESVKLGLGRRNAALSSLSFDFHENKIQF